MARLLAEPRRLLVSILVGNTLVNIAAASLGAVVVIGLLPEAGEEAAGGRAIIWATLVMTALILFFGEIAPKSYALKYNERLARLIAGPLTAFIALIAPLRAVLEKANDFLFRLTRGIAPDDPGLSSDELATAVDMGHASGVVDAFEREVISNIIGLEDLSVGEIMTPRVEVVALPLETPRAEWLECFRTSGFSRLPVIGTDLDHILGICYAKDLLAPGILPGEALEAGSLMRDAFYVPESMKAVDLLAEFRRRQLHFAVVIDEFGSTAGVITMEDLLEEIVGDIADSRDEEEAPFKPIEPGVAVVYAGMELEDFAAEVGYRLTDRNAETVGGWLTHRLGRIPVSGEELTLGPFTIRILSARPTRVLWMRVEWRRK